jgi:polar amino acid transport system substrate-binding protein
MNRAIYSLGLAIALAVSSGAGALAQTQDTIRLTNGEWPPFLSEHAPHYGFASHIITEAFALVGVEVGYGFFPWKRSYKLAKEGKWDGSAIWWDNEERRELFYFTDPVGSTKEAFFHLKTKAFDWTTYEDLRELRIGGTHPYDYGKAFNQAEAAGIIQTERAPNDETSLKKMLKGRIDVFPGDVMVTYEQIRKTFSDEEAALFTHHPKPIAERPVYLLLSKMVPGNEQMLGRFNEGLRMLKESGRWDQIIADGLAGKYDAKSE